MIRTCAVLVSTQPGRPAGRRVCHAPTVVRLSRRVVGWVVLGLAASAVELGLLKVLYEGLAWPLPVATAIAAEVLILVKFVIADRWVFGHPVPTWSRLLRYHGASAGALAVYWVAVNSLVELLGLPYTLAFILGTGAAFVWSLISNFLWVWAA